MMKLVAWIALLIIVTTGGMLPQRCSMVADDDEPDPARFEEPAKPAAQLPPAVAYLVAEPTEAMAVADRYAGAVLWALVRDDEGAPTVIATVELPGQGLTATISFGLSPMAHYSHEVAVLVTYDEEAGLGQVAEVVGLSLKADEDSVGEALDGDTFALGNFVVVGLPDNLVAINMQRLAAASWFDLALVFESGRRALVVFSKGAEGETAFTQALADWAISQGE